MSSPKRVTMEGPEGKGAPADALRESFAQMSSTAIYRRLLAYARPYTLMIILGMVCSAIAGVTGAGLSYVLRPLTDQGFSGNATHPLWVYPAAIVALFIIRGVFTFINSYVMAYVGNRVLSELRRQMFERLISLPTRFFDERSSSSLVSRIVFEAANVSGSASTIITNVVSNGFTVLSLVAYLMYVNWQLTLLSLVLLPVTTYIVRIFSRRMRGLSRNNMYMTGELTRVVQETIDCQKVVKVYGGEEAVRSTFRHTIDRLRGNAMRITVTSSGTVPITQLISSISLGAVIYFALQQAAAHQMTVGDFVSFLVAMLQLLAPLKQLADISGPFERGMAAAEGVFSLIDETPEDDRGTVTVERVKGDIAFVDVSLRYPGTPRPALSHVNLTVGAGETIALVGGSGGGKTSLANLIPRFYHATEGQILIDRLPIETLTIASLRAQIAFVSQDVVLFNDTIGANIAYGGASRASADEIKAAARAAHLLDFIEEQPLGFGTLIGENGVRLSGGQRQRLAIARAILKNAPILILDEATSALDSESERHVQMALDTLMQNRTTLVIAHRLSTIENATRIVVLERGQIAEIGTHRELLAREGIYANLYRIQYAHEHAAMSADGALNP